MNDSSVDYTGTSNLSHVANIIINVSSVILSEDHKQARVPYSTEITPTLIACYKAATGGMGLISKTVVLPRN